MLCKGFAPLLGKQARVLILGSMPGGQSLKRQEYYAFEHNCFWWMMGELLGAGWDLPYAERVARVVGRSVAVWDVLASCERSGSLDSAIEAASEEVNDFRGLLLEHPIELVLFNGGKAEQAWKRHVQPLLADWACQPECKRLPSTSPAYAAVSRSAKLDAWRTALGAIL